MEDYLSGERIGLFILVLLMILVFFSPFFMTGEKKQAKNVNVAIIGYARYQVPDLVCRYALLRVDGEIRRVKTILGRPFTPGYRIDLYQGPPQIGQNEKVLETVRLS